MRLLIQTGQRLTDLTDADLDAFAAAITDREHTHGKRLQHYHRALYATRAVLYHLGGCVTPAGKWGAAQPWSWSQHFLGVPDHLAAPLVSYLECAAGTRTWSTVSKIAGRLAHFARFLTSIDPDLSSLSGLDRQRHIEPYLAAVAAARHRHTGAPLSASERRSRIFTLARMIDDIIEWGWAEAPTRRLVFSRDAPRVPRPLPRYLSPDTDRQLSAALQASPNRLRADALLLLRATGMRIGELVNLELDCVHEVPDAGAWLKVPLGKLDTERMVPLDDQTIDLVDRIVAHRSPGRPLPHPRTGKLVEFLLTHQGRRVCAETLRDELARVCAAAGLPATTPHQLRHTYATALVNAGVSLQSLMALLGHVSAEMSLRYGRLFDATVRDEYQRALDQAKQRFGSLLPEQAPACLASIDTTTTDWRDAPLIKTRLASGHCLRTLAQGPCQYANICEHCPNLRTEPASLATLTAQRADAQALASDAAARGWDTEVTRHRNLIDRIDTLINRTAS
jgi:site-specific recombinase XerD